MEQYYIRHNGRIYGGLTRDRIRECLQQGLFFNEDAVSGDRQDWMPLTGLAAKIAAPSPVDPSPSAGAAMSAPRISGALPKGSEKEEPPREAVVFVLLAVFLGWLGVHDFYAGYESKGITKLMISLGGLFLFGLGPVISMIMAIFDAVKVKQDANGRKFIL
ncbi:MAG: NINE protein [Victivallaceae bacterium]|nr:TM2 domain-containing protein [Victivallaceae bacterium]